MCILKSSGVILASARGKKTERKEAKEEGRKGRRKEERRERKKGRKGKKGKKGRIISNYTLQRLTMNQYVSFLLQL